jgi:GTPase SAR1 family protein
VDKAETCEYSISVAAYYRGAMGTLLVYDVTDESSFNSTIGPVDPIVVAQDLVVIPMCFVNDFRSNVMLCSAPFRVKCCLSHCCTSE